MAEKILDPVSGLALDWIGKRNDRLPTIEASLSADLTTALGVRFVMRPYTAAGTPSAPLKINTDAVVEECHPATYNDDGTLKTAAYSLVRYDWSATDLDTSGIYRAEWAVEWPGGKPQSFPTDAYHLIGVYDDLDGMA